MDFGWSDNEQAFRRELRDFVDANLRPSWGHPDREMATVEQWEYSTQFCEQLAERGLLIAAWPKEYGGRDLTLWEQLIISEELWGAGEPRGAQYMNVNWIGPALMKAGTSEQKEFHLKRMTAGDATWCQGFSEPDAGSDLSALKTRAVRDGDVYIVNGQKVWTSYAHRASHCFLLTRTRTGENQRDGITILLVPMDLPGIEVREIPSMEEHMVHEVFFRDVNVPVSCRLGPEHDGWKLITTILANERVGAARFEHADRMLDAIVEEMEDLHLPLDDHALAVIGKAAAWDGAARLLNYSAITEAIKDSPQRSVVASVYRVAVTTTESVVAQAFTELLGGEALIHESRGDFQVKTGLVSSIAAGSMEIQLNNVARFGLGLPKGN